MKPKIDDVNLDMYEVIIEDVAKEDGGGFRKYHPTLGYAVYGVGDTLEAVMESYEESKASFFEFLASKPNLALPKPTRADLVYYERSSAIVANNNFAYAA